MEYIVTIEPGVDKTEFINELKADGIGVIVRAVDPTDLQPLSARNVTVDLGNEDEYWALMQDQRVRDVVSVEEMLQLKPSPTTVQNINPVLSPFNFASHDNWALDFCTRRDNATYLYSHTGAGVDVVLVDSGIYTAHAQFKDSQGVSRIQQIEWKTNQSVDKPSHYTDQDGHGTAVASCAAGLTQGFARGAHIYAIKIFDTDAYTPLEALQLVRAWHNAKTNGRPTVVNCSWVYKRTYPTNHPTMSERDHPVQVSSVDAEIESLIADGTIVVAAAGNDAHYVAATTDAAYNDYYYVDSNGLYTDDIKKAVGYYRTNRLTPGGAGTCLCVGSNGDAATSNRFIISSFSNRGTRINLFAPGDYVKTAATSSTTAYQKISGTSFSSPHTAGISALHLETRPTANQSQVSAFLVDYGNDNETTGTLDGSTNVSLNSVYAGMIVKSGVQKRLARVYVKSGGSWVPAHVRNKVSGAWQTSFGIDR